jgi:hypothetical protein
MPADAPRAPAPLPFEVGLRVSVPHGPRAYLGPAAGHCLGGQVPPNALLLADPDATPEIGDLVAVWFEHEHAVVVLPGGAQYLTVEAADLALDPDIRALLLAGAVAQPPGPRCFVKILKSPLPPRHTWADDFSHQLIVEMLEPHLELRASLSTVLALDKVVAIVTA